MSEAGLEGGLNPYEYAKGNPTMYTDPSGLFVNLDGATSSPWFTLNNSTFSITYNHSVGHSTFSADKFTMPSIPNNYSRKTWDVITDRRIAQLDSRVQRPATNFINQVESELGINLRMVQGLRTFAEQNALYAQGRTTQGRVVTNARGGDSYHNYGLAFDVAIMQGGNPVWKPIPPEVATIGISNGFEWGGNWKSFKDYPHFQMTFGQTLDELKSQR